MDGKILEKVLNDKEFIIELAQQTDLNEVKKMLDGVGINLTDEELIQLRDEVKANAKKLQDKELENVSAGANTASKVLVGTGGAMAGAGAGFALGAMMTGVGCMVAEDALNSSKLDDEDKKRKKKIGLLAAGIAGIALPTLGGAILGGYGGCKWVDRKEKENKK